jgi:hypothetical protein
LRARRRLAARKLAQYDGGARVPATISAIADAIAIAVRIMARRGYNLELKAPAGKFRVVGVDLLSHEDYLKGDYDSRAEAYKVADDHNTKQSGSMDDIYYVYDDQGTYIRGNGAVGQKISP